MSSTRRQSPKSAEREEALAGLREFLEPGDTVYTILRHVSRSGMQRAIDLQVIRNNEPRWIGYLAAKAMGRRYDDRQQGVVIGGCGMDMGAALVFDLARTLWPDGCKCLGRGERAGTSCPSSDHVNRGPERDNYDPEHVHADSYYFLRQRWI